MVDEDPGRVATARIELHLGLVSVPVVRVL